MQLPPLPTEHKHMSFHLIFNFFTSHNHTQQQVQQQQHQRRKREVKMSDFAKAVRKFASTQTVTPILRLPKELHLRVFDLLNPIDGTCLSLSCTLLYNRSPRFPYPSIIPLDAPFIFIPSRQVPDLPPPPLPLNTGSPLSRNPVVQARGCRFCLPVLHYPAHCELHFHIQEFMVKDMKYCAGKCAKYTYSLAHVKQGRGKGRFDERHHHRRGCGGGFSMEMGRSHHRINEREGRYEVEEMEDIDMEGTNTTILLPADATEVNSAINNVGELYGQEADLGAWLTFPFPAPGNWGGNQQNHQGRAPRVPYEVDGDLSPESNILSYTLPPAQFRNHTHGMQSQLRLPPTPQQLNPPQRRLNFHTHYQSGPPLYQPHHHRSHTYQYQNQTLNNTHPSLPPNYLLPDPPPPYPQSQHISPHSIHYHYQPRRSPSPDPNYGCAEICGTCRVPYNKRFERGRRMVEITRPDEIQSRVRRWYNHGEGLRTDGDGSEEDE